MLWFEAKINRAEPIAGRPMLDTICLGCVIGGFEMRSGRTHGPLAPPPHAGLEGWQVSGLPRVDAALLDD